MRVVVAEHCVRDLEVVGNGEDARRCDQVLLEGAGDRHHLVHRARLVHVGDRRVVDRRSRTVGPRDEIGHGEDLARGRVGDHRDAALRVRGHDLLAEGALGLVLQRPVDGEHQVVAPLRGAELTLARRDLVALRVALGDELSGRTREHAVVRELDASQPCVVGAHLAEHGCGERTGGHEPLGLVEERDAGQVQRVHPARRGVVDLPCEVDERRAPAEAVAQHALVHVQHRRQGACLAGGVAYLPGIGPHGLLRHRQRQLAPVPVVDRAARRGEHDAVNALRPSDGRVPAR